MSLQPIFHIQRQPTVHHSSPNSLKSCSFVECYLQGLSSMQICLGGPTNVLRRSEVA
jgi:hypothetical protein